MKDEYIIISKSNLLKRIEELEEIDSASWEFKAGQIKELKEILSQSIPLVTEIEKAFSAGEEYNNDSCKAEEERINAMTFYGGTGRCARKNKYLNCEDYTNQLKLDIQCIN